MKRWGLIVSILIFALGVFGVAVGLALHFSNRRESVLAERADEPAGEVAREASPEGSAAPGSPAQNEPATSSVAVAAGTGTVETPKPKTTSLADSSTAPPPLTAWLEDPRLLGMISPIAGAAVSGQNSHLPNQPRAYRGGAHEGLDYYNGHVLAPVAWGSPVMAVGDGTVIRADAGYVEMVKEDRDRKLAAAVTDKATPEALLDELRGRTVVIEHAPGAVSRYCHLSGVAAGIAENAAVKQGQVIGYVGNSGTSGGVVDSKTVEVHLHFEFWLDGHFLGEGLSAAEVRELYRKSFPPQAPQPSAAAP